MKNENLKTTIIVALVVAFLFSIVSCAKPSEKLHSFSSMQEIKSFLSERSGSAYYGGFGVRKAVAETAVPTAAATLESAADYSATNIQVEGVDEADIVKNDGKYIYTVSGNKVIIVDAYPADSAKVLSEISFDNSDIREIFINNDYLIVFGHENEAYMAEGIAASRRMPYYSQRMFAKVYDISDRSNPVLVRNIEIEGSYLNSRMIGDYVYVIASQPVYYYNEGNLTLPRIYEGIGAKTVKQISPSEIYYLDMYDNSYVITTILSFNVGEDGLNRMSILTGYSESLYVSQDNIYLVYNKGINRLYYQNMIIEKAVLPALPKQVSSRIEKIMSSGADEYNKSMEMSSIMQDYTKGLGSEEEEELENRLQEKMLAVQQELAKELEKTVIQRISVNNGNIRQEASGTVPGRVLNQFSMDEFANNFRIATTTGQLSRSGPSSSNHIYVLDMELNIVGKLENLAPGESIYSARFIGKRAYLVTFRKVDPLFVIDLSAPESPKVLGKLKIPGYSDYLHPYDDNYIIGIGKEAVAAEEGDFAWYQGVKLALFDVSDVENPREVSKVEIGDRGTDSYALQDHKAFLFSRSKNLLVMPVLLAEIDKSRYAGDVPPQAYGDFVWQGAYVFDVSLENGFVLKGKVTHVADDSLQKSGYYYYSPYSVKRSLYMDDVLYTISDKAIKMNDLASMEEINSVGLPYEEQNPMRIY